MANDIQITKILLFRGESANLPVALEPAELAFTTDDGRLFLGLDPGYKGEYGNRLSHPYQNLEVITENSEGVFATMHGNRMRRGGGDDYYTCTLEPSDDWAAVQIERETQRFDYTILNTESVSAFIDYGIYLPDDGTLVRMGDMTLRYHRYGPAEPFLEDSGPRSLSVDHVDLRFKLEGHLNAPYLVFQYRNPHTDPVILRFKVSRPTPTYNERKEPVQSLSRIAATIPITASLQGDHFEDSSGTISAPIIISSLAFGTGEIIVFEGWYARARIRLINPTTGLQGGDVQIRPVNTDTLPFNDLSLSGGSTGDLFYPDQTPQRIYDADGFGVTLYWNDPRAMDTTEARLRLQFSTGVGDDMRATFAFQRWNQGSATINETIAPKTSSTVINPPNTSWSQGDPFDIRNFWQDVWYFDISI